MNRLIMWLILAVTMVTVGFLAWPKAELPATNSVVRLPNIVLNTALQPGNNNQNANSAAPTNSPLQAPAVTLPVAGFYGRITKKPFGIYITPATSPIQPERFQGYHTGADAETVAAEKNIDVPVFAVADGTVVVARYVSGYGGVVMIRHRLNAQTVTTLYGHLRLSSLSVKVGQSVTSGQIIGLLGTGFTAETDGERKHLHFGVLKGSSTNVRGYVSAKSQLSAWADPVTWLKSLRAAEPEV